MTSTANQARIRQWDWNDATNALYAKDVVSFARSKGLYSGSDADFSFSDVYDPVAFSGARVGEARVWALFMAMTNGAAEIASHLDYAQVRGGRNNFRI